MNDNRPLALVTGASSGIGYELVKQFAEHGYDLLINAEDERLDEAARHLRETGAEVRAVRADLRDPAGVDHLVASTTGLHVDVASSTPAWAGAAPSSTPTCPTTCPSST